MTTRQKKPKKRGLEKSPDQKRLEVDEKGTGEAEDGLDFVDGDLDAAPMEIKRIPIDQVKLTEEQKSEVFTKVVTATDPNVSKAICRFDYKEGEYKLDPRVDHLAVHFNMPGVLIHVESDEAREQQAYISERGQPIEQRVNTAASTDNLEGDFDGTTDQASSYMSTSTTAATTGTTPAGNGRKLILKNQFNFSERATQTFNNPMRDREVATEPPPTQDFSADVTHWEIFDTYLEDLERQILARETKDAKKPSKNAQDDEDLPTQTPEPTDIFESDRMAKAMKIMERMVNQNAEAECFHQYKYFEDKNEHKHEGGKLLQLWRFGYDKAKKKTVTAICWNQEFTDLFAVGYGSYDFMKQGPGLIACYTLKNTSYPEYVFTTESGVMCLDFHPQHSALLACGLYDGTVCVYDVRSRSNTPIYISSDPKCKHTDPVWQVHWQKEDVGKNINFYSISSDGRVTNWIMNKNELVNEEVVELKLVPRTDEDQKEPDGNMVGLAGGCCFDFNRTAEHLFVVGTEEGAIHSYSKAYNSQYLKSYEGHHMAVYTVRWNTFHPGVFLSCSADWTVKLWEHTTSQPVMTFDLNCSVSDVAWAPFSSTVFAVITSDAKLRVYDLSINKHEPLCTERVSRLSKKARLTHLAFNPKEFIIAVGDDRGVVTIFKLSANLHRMTASKLEDIEPAEEIQKLEKKMIMPDGDGNSVSRLMNMTLLTASNLIAKTSESKSGHGSSHDDGEEKESKGDRKEHKLTVAMAGVESDGSGPRTAKSTGRQSDRKVAIATPH